VTVTTEALEATLVEARDQIKTAKAQADITQAAALAAERHLFELQTKAWILEARLLERGEKGAT
jgi:hypothetical protein